MRRIVVMTLVFCLTGAPLFAQTLQSSVDRAVASELAAQGGGRGPMPPAWKWTGIALLAAGAGYMAIGAALGDEALTCSGNTCLYVSEKRAYVAGGVLLGVGAAFLIIGNNKRSNSPQILTGPGRIGLKQTLTF